jgi:CRP-like cAMP-binding protein
MRMLPTTIQMFSALGSFSDEEQQWFMQHLQWYDVKEGAMILSEGDICDAVYFLEEGYCYQYKQDDEDEKVIDLHLPGEWIFIQQSLVRQEPSMVAIRAFQGGRVARLGLKQMHALMSLAPAFLQFGRLFNQGQERLLMFDETMDPAEKYAYLMRTRPEIAAVFPVKMIASYLKLAPETLSRVRAKYRIS